MGVGQREGYRYKVTWCNEDTRRPVKTSFSVLIVLVEKCSLPCYQFLVEPGSLFIFFPLYLLFHFLCCVYFPYLVIIPGFYSFENKNNICCEVLKLNVNTYTYKR